MPNVLSMGRAILGRCSIKSRVDVPSTGFYIGGSNVTAAQLAGTNGVAAAADGAITQKQGVVVITKAGVAVLTIANPTATTDDFKELEIISATANAHTVSNAAGAGFNAGGAATDVGTFGGAKGDNMRIIAYQGVWYVVLLRNVTLG